MHRIQEMNTSLLIGTMIKGRYIVEDILGKGEFGTVYLVRDKRDNQKLFVLKEISSPASKEPDRIPFETVLLQQLHHPALPRVYQILRDDIHGCPYLLMDFVEGTSLETLQAEQSGHCLPLSQVMTLMAPIIEALIYLHNQQPPIIHQHIKPSSIIKPKVGARTMLVGFSFIKKYDADKITTTVRYGSPGYTAPEQYSTTRRISSRTDIYALGATLYTLLTGTVPAEALYRLAQLRQKSPDPLVPANEIIPTISPTIAWVIQRAMSISSDDRFPTVERFRDALWQASISPSEAQQIPPYMVAATNEAKRE